jgi:hypothetical protein
MNLVLVNGNIVKCVSIVKIEPPSRFSIIIFLMVLVEEDRDVKSSLIFGNESTLSCLVLLKQDGASSCKSINRWSCWLALLYIAIARDKHREFRWIVALITDVCEHIIPCDVFTTWKIYLNATISKWSKPYYSFSSSMKVAGLIRRAWPNMNRY